MIKHSGLKFFFVSVILSFTFSCKTPKAGFDEKHAIVLDTMQITAPRENPYRASATRVHDLVHTRLEVRFDWEHQWLYGKAQITVKPHIYPQKTLLFDARNMDIYKVELLSATGNSAALTYSYDSVKLNINLDHEYQAGEQYTVLIDYKAKPNEHHSGGSEAIQDDKGLYFINPLGTDTDKPREIWTQGETESNSNWFPTFDKPNFKATNEIYITVEKKYTTLSNGLLISQKDNTDGTRTDYWRMDLPHSPYLVMMAIGDWVITKDKWRDKEVSYYIEPKFAPYTRRMFSQTPAMMEYFSNLLGVPYPWQKYAQVVVRDYVSGAMENTSATLHGENLNRSPRQMLDEDFHDYISHELFHQWFGDLVTAESWSNITVNESMADYSEYLWNDYKYGAEYADWKFYQARTKYMNETRRGKNVDLVRFHYDDKEEVFDAHSYEKGGQIQNMLRHAVGDSAYFKSLQLYLLTNQFKNAEAHQMRLAFEEITGRDMNWFWNQWYYSAGHPVLNFEYSYANDSVYVAVSQKHNIDKPLTYELPFTIAIHYGNITTTHPVVLTKKKQTFAFKALNKPDLIDADDDRILLCEKTENKTTEQYIFQYEHGSRYVQRLEALDSLRFKQRTNNEVAQLFRHALHDRNEAIRAYAIKYLLITTTNKDTLLPMLQVIIGRDSATRVRAAVLDILGKQKATNYTSLIEKSIGDSSYLVAASALTALSKVDSSLALTKAKLFDKEKVFDIQNAVYTIAATYGDSSYEFYFIKKMQAEKGYSKYFLFYHYANFLCRMPMTMVDRGIDTMQHIVAADKDKNKQILNFATGAVERIKEYYERKRGGYDSMLNAQQKSPKKYTDTTLQAEIATMDKIIAHSKAALEDMK